MAEGPFRGSFPIWMASSATVTREPGVCHYIEGSQGTDRRLPVFVSWTHYTDVAIFKARTGKILRIFPPPISF